MESWFSTESDFTRVIGYLTMSGDILVVTTGGRGDGGTLLASHYWVEARDAARHLQYTEQPPAQRLIQPRRLIGPRLRTPALKQDIPCVECWEHKDKQELASAIVGDPLSDGNRQITLTTGCDKCCDRGVYTRLLRVEEAATSTRRSTHFTSSDFPAGIWKMISSSRRELCMVEKQYAKASKCQPKGLQGHQHCVPGLPKPKTDTVYFPKGPVSQAQKEINNLTGKVIFTAFF